MKNLLLTAFCIMALLTSCKDDDDPEPIEEEARYVVEIKKQSKDASGNITVNPQNAIVYIWKAEGRDFDVSESGTDIYLGYAYDKMNNVYRTAEYGSVGPRMDEKIDPGRYFIYVLLPKSSNQGSLANSYTYFDVKAGDVLSMRKTFSHDIGSGQTEAWNKNK